MVSFVSLSCCINALSFKLNFCTESFECNFNFAVSEYSLMSKLTNFVIWNKFNSFHYAETKNLLI